MIQMLGTYHGRGYGLQFFICYDRIGKDHNGHIFPVLLLCLSVSGKGDFDLITLPDIIMVAEHDKFCICRLQKKREIFAGGGSAFSQKTDLSGKGFSIFLYDLFRMIL